MTPQRFWRKEVGGLNRYDLSDRNPSGLELYEQMLRIRQRGRLMGDRNDARVGDRISIDQVVAVAGDD